MSWRCEGCEKKNHDDYTRCRRCLRRIVDPDLRPPLIGPKTWNGSREEVEMMLAIGALPKVIAHRLTIPLNTVYRIRRELRALTEHLPHSTNPIHPDDRQLDLSPAKTQTADGKVGCSSDYSTTPLLDRSGMAPLQHPPIIKTTPTQEPVNAIPPLPPLRKCARRPKPQRNCD